MSLLPANFKFSATPNVIHSNFLHIFASTNSMVKSFDLAFDSAQNFCIKIPGYKK